MSSLTLSVSSALKHKMDEFPEINWSEVARQAIAQKIMLLDKMNRMLKNSKLTKSDTVLLGRRVNKASVKST